MDAEFRYMYRQMSYHLNGSLRDNSERNRKVGKH
jgi:hypothetical protein